MNIYLDDKRQNPQGFVLTKTVEDTIILLKLYENEVDILSLDHDLGSYIQTGYDVLLWIEKEMFLNGYIPPKKIHIHTTNPSARVKMELAVKRIEKGVS